jgi:signal transduction histidine kinase/CHASE3 domain sensor protein
MSTSLEAFKTRVKIDLSVIGAGLLLLAGLTMLFFKHFQEEKDNEWVVHTYQVIDRLKAIEALLVDTETGVRGYLATGDPLFLQPYEQALPHLSTTFRTLPQLVSDNLEQQQRAHILNQLAQAKLTVVQLQIQKNEASRTLMIEGKRRMDAVRSHVAQMVAVEQSLMEIRTRRVKTGYQLTTLLTTVLMVLAVLASRQAHLLIQRESKRRKEAQTNARQSAELLQTVVNTIPSGIVLYEAVRDPAGQIIDFAHTLSNPVNDTLVGRSTDELRRLSLLEHQPAVRTNGYFDDLVEVVETGQPLRRLIHGKSSTVDSWFDTQYLKQGDGVLSTYLDVTVLKQAELNQQQQAKVLQTMNHELQRSNASLQSFAYIASHDLQEPLRKIEAFGNLFELDYGDQFDERAATYISRMRSAASRMSLLIRDLLAYSRLSSTPPVLKCVSLPLLITDILDDLEIVRQRSGVKIVLGELPTLKGDPTQLRQLMQNLIGNAIKFSEHPPGGDVSQIRIASRTVSASDLPVPLSVEPQQDFWEISVQDNGIGFNPKYLDRIFEVFQRLHDKQQFSGSGIGLAICQRVVDNHGGAITASSQEGQGATFYVYLPRLI